MLKRKIVGISAALAAALMLSSCSSGDGGGGSDNSSGGSADLDTANPVLIGLDVDLTGPAAPTGKPGLDGVQIAVDEINANGGILGREVKILQGDDESDPTKIPTVTRKLVDDGASALIYITGSGAVLQVKSIVKDLEIPSIAATTQTEAVSAAPDNEYMFALANPATDLAPIWCDVWKEKGYTKLGILHDDSAAIAGTMDAVRPILDDCVDIVAEESAPSDATDLSAQVARIKSADPDVMLIYTVGGSFEVLAQNTIGAQMPDVLRFESGSIANSPELWDLVNPGELSKAVYMSNFSSDKQKTKDLTETVQKRLGNDAGLSLYTAQGYDAVYLLKDAIEAAGGTDDPTKIRDSIEGIQGYVPSYGQDGFTFSFSKDKHLGADGSCSLILSSFGEDNRPSGPWPDYQVDC